MRNTVSLNSAWEFYKNTADVTALSGGETVNLPHSWNATDGQDGGNDYFRGTCIYTKKLIKSELPSAERYYLEIRGANSSADVYVNGEKLAHHDGGYSTWRVDITDKLGETAELAIAVDNAPNDRVYPQMADFTFYGGLYRDVNLICVPATHFELDYFGTPGIKVTPTVKDNGASVEVEVYTTELGADDEIVYTVCQADGAVVGEFSAKDKVHTFDISDVHL